VRPIPVVLYEALFLDFCNDLRTHLRPILTEDEVASVFKPEARQSQIESLQQAGVRYRDPYSVVDLGAFRQLVLTYRKKLVPSTNDRALDERNWAALNENFGVIVNVRNHVAHPTDANYPSLQAAVAAIEAAIAVLAMLGLNTNMLGRHLSELARIKPAKLPQPSRRFVLPTPGPIFGRSNELARLQEMLAPGGPRLVTITGQGGVGKTRLAIAAAETIASRYTNVAFIDLVGAKRWTEAKRLLGQAVGARSESNSALEDAFGSQPRLVVLDNFEHLVRDGAHELGALVKRAEGSIFVVTSVERLGLVTERILRLGALSPPSADDSAGDLATNPAMALFISRVASARGRYRPPAAEMADIAEICRRVGGLPLAISIAAGHAVERPPSIVLRNLGHFLATRGEIERSDRHQTMDACLDWSWRLITKDERAVWRRCSFMFVGGSSETICEVCSFGGLSKQRVEAATAGLVRHSLLELDDSRFRLPELVRQYGVDKLSEYEVQRVATAMILWATSLVNKLLRGDGPGDSATREEALVQAATVQTFLSMPAFPRMDIALSFLVAVARASSDPNQAFGHWGNILIDRFKIYKPGLRNANPRVAAEAAVEVARLRTAQSADREAEAAALFAVRQAVSAGDEDLVLGATAVFMTACGRRTQPRKRLMDLLSRTPRSRTGMLAMSQLAFPGYPDQGEDFDWDFAISGLCRVARLWLRDGGVKEAVHALDEVQFAINVFALPDRIRLEALKLLEQLPDRNRAAGALVDWAQVLLELDDVPAIDQLQPQRPHLANRPRPVLLQSRRLLIRALGINPSFDAATMLAMVETDLGHEDAALDALRLVLKAPAPDGNGVMLVARLSALMVVRPGNANVPGAIWQQLLHWAANWLRANGNRIAGFGVDSAAGQGSEGLRRRSTLNENERAMALKSVDGLPLDRVFSYVEAEAWRIVARRSAEARSRLGIKLPDSSPD
jgi:predicted ATPase